MTQERELEIERLVIYKAINYMPYDTIDPVSAFNVGRMIGIMQETLRNELHKEVNDSAPIVTAIPIERIKQLREQVEDYNVRETHTGSESYLRGVAIGLDTAAELIDNMIKEFEE